MWNLLKKYWIIYNENLAVWIANKFNTIECFWILLAFSAAGLLPRLLPYNTYMLYISNCIQLVALPVLGFSMVVIEKRSKRRAEELQEGHENLQQVHSEHTQSLEDIYELVKKLNDHFVPEKHTK